MEVKRLKGGVKGGVWELKEKEEGYRYYIGCEGGKYYEGREGGKLEGWERVRMSVRCWEGGRVGEGRRE